MKRQVVIVADDKRILKEQLQHLAERIQIEGQHMENESLIIDYDNGGGQSGVRENPYYPAYEKLLASYVKTLQAAKELCGSEDEEVRNLDNIRQKFRVVK